MLICSMIFIFHFSSSSAIKTKAKNLKGFLAGEQTYTEEEDHQIHLCLGTHEHLSLPQRREATAGDGTRNVARRRGLSAEGQRRAPHEYHQLASELSAIAAPKPHNDGLAKVAVAAGGRDDIALDAGSPIRVEHFPSSYDVSVHLDRVVFTYERPMMFQTSVLST
ncbi:hypothetical protein EDD85DRAFT_1007954 [Armillaria nabsnona]|nr:hypothetical protein EDD85DRAFT_1007954 [Armillaria nabsnona]